MTTTVYRSTDGGAPSLTNTAGSLIDVLDYALLSSGWSKPYTDTNSAVYRQGSGNQFYLQVNDNGLNFPPPTIGAGSVSNAALVTGYKTMSSYSIGTSPFPAIDALTPGTSPTTNDPAQFANRTAIYFRKTSTGSATAWVIVATDKAFYMWTNWGGAPSRNQMYFFGDYTTIKNDGNNCLLLGTISQDPSNFNNVSGEFEISTAAASSATIINAHVLPANYLGIPIPISIAKGKDGGVDDTNFLSVDNTTTLGLTYPDPFTNNLFLTPVYIMEAVYNPTSNIVIRTIRGTFPGLWSACTAFGAFCTNGDTLDGTGDLAGRSFEIFEVRSADICMFIETSSTW